MQKTASSTADIITARVTVGATVGARFNLLNPVGAPVGANSTDSKPVRAGKGIGILMADLADLINPQFRSWYYRKFLELGFDETMKLAQIARADGRNPQNLFNAMLKKAQA